MIEGLLCIIGIYALTILLIHVSYKRFGMKQGKRSHIVMMTHNNQNDVEWAICSIRFLHWLQGKDVTITAIDHHSQDDTLPILERLAHRGLIQLYLCGQEQEYDFKDCVVVHLNPEEEWQTI